MLLAIPQLPFSAKIHFRSLLLPDKCIGKTYQLGAPDDLGIIVLNFERAQLS